MDHPGRRVGGSSEHRSQRVSGILRHSASAELHPLDRFATPTLVAGRSAHA
jgi:hypothetical protein